MYFATASNELNPSYIIQLQPESNIGISEIYIEVSTTLSAQGRNIIGRVERVRFIGPGIELELTRTKDMPSEPPPTVPEQPPEPPVVIVVQPSVPPPDLQAPNLGNSTEFELQSEPGAGSFGPAPPPYTELDPNLLEQML